MGKIIFDEDSVIQNSTNIEKFIPPYPGWNYVKVLNHPEDPDPFHNIKEGVYKNNVGKWLLFIPNQDFFEVFRQIAKLAKQFKLTHCFKASGEPTEKGEHVFCIYCGDYTKIAFVRKIGNVLINEGLLDKYGWTYRNGGKALFFKTDSATEYMSISRGKSLTLFKINNDKELYVKEFTDGKPSWKLITNDDDSNIVNSFEMHLTTLSMEDIDGDL